MNESAPVLTEEQFKEFMEQQREHNAAMQVYISERSDMEKSVSGMAGLVKDQHERYIEDKRDWFAGQIIGGFCSQFNGGKGDPEWFEQIGVPASYRIADAMMKERKKGETQ